MVSSYGFWYHSNLYSLGGAQMRKVQCATSATFAKGDLLAVTATGYYAIATVAMIPAYVAAEAAAAVDAGTKKLAIPIRVGDLFEAKCSGTLTQAQIGTVVDFEGATGAQMVNENASSQDTLRIISLAREQAAVGATAKVLVSFNKCAFGNGLSS